MEATVPQRGFNGSFDMVKDNKNRITVPAPFAKVLEASGESEDLMVSVSYENVMQVRTRSAWQRAADKMQAELSDRNENSRKLQRFFMAESHAAAMDSNKRITLPQRLLAECGIDKEISVLGVGDCFEIWDRARWNQERAELMGRHMDIMRLAQ